MILRPYQIQGVNMLRDCIKKGYKIPILGMPTGAGKTVTFAHLIDLSLKKGSTVLVVAHRKELIEQAKPTLSAYGVDIDRVHFGMVQTFVRSPHKIPVTDLVIIDECHIGNFRRFIELLNPRTQVIGVTATPMSSSKKNPLNKIFDKVVYPVQINDLVKGGYLSFPNYHIWQIDESLLEKDSKGEYTAASQSRVFSMKDLKEAVDNRIGKTIIFCSSIEQSMKVFDSIDDYRKFVVHSKLNYKDRKHRIETYKKTPNSIMVNCGILTAGFDDPSIETVIVYRATTSLPLWLQMVGRGARVTENKNNFYIFDLGNNHNRLLPWEVSRQWDHIFLSQGKKYKEGAAPIKQCKECDAQIAASARICPFCGHEMKIKEKEDLKSIGIKVIESYSEIPSDLKKPFKDMSVEELVARAAYGSPELKRPYKISWIVNTIKKRSSFKEDIFTLARIKGYKPAWAKRQLLFNH